MHFVKEQLIYMGMNKTIKIEVAYGAGPDVQRVISLAVEAGTTIEKAIEYSGILTIFPEINLANQSVGIFSKPAFLTQLVKEGDRIEIYRALSIHPMEARRQKAKRQKNT